MTLDPEKINDFTLGIVGGGQLGKMLTQEAKTMGLRVVVLDPIPFSPAGEICDRQIVSDFFDREGFLELASESDLVTYEFEHISSHFLKELEGRGKIVLPSSKTLEIIQDKKRQKEFLKANNIPVVSFAAVDDLESLKEALKKLGLPAMLKISNGGYDGKGNRLIEAARKNDGKMEPELEKFDNNVCINMDEELEKAYNELGGAKTPMYLEKHLNFRMEVSVMAARNKANEIVNYPVVENVHKENILHSTRAPADLPESIKSKVEEISCEIMELFQDVGIYGIEYFIGEDNEIYVNEIAPRPHNSGHYTIEACDISQFQTHLRAILGLPLRKPRLLRPAVMMNLLGQGKEGKPIVKNLEEALKIEGLSFHLYRKKESRPKRKMAHFTVCSDSIEEAKEKAEKAFSHLKITGA